MTEAWNREALYGEVWEQPLVKIALKYGISAVMLGKICRKLLIPLPGRGYWAKKEFGKPVQRVPLPEAKNVPVLHRSTDPVASAVAKVQEPIPTDPEYVRIIEIESRTLAVGSHEKVHKLVSTSRRCLQNAKPNDRGLVEPRYDQACLDLRVAPASLERALSVMNAIILALESEGFPVTLRPGEHRPGAEIFGYRISLAIVEKLREKGRKEIKEYSWTRNLIDYEPRGTLEFRAGDYGSGRKVRDGKVGRLEEILSKCVGALLREGRDCIIRVARQKEMELERQEKARQRAELAPLIWEEEKKVSQLEGWVTQWSRAQQMREFIAALEKSWAAAGHDLSSEAPKGKRIIWMRQQADRVDPVVESPPSVLDRKGELNSW